MQMVERNWKQQQQQQGLGEWDDDTSLPPTTNNCTALKSYFHFTIMPYHDKKLGSPSARILQEDVSAES
jgi:hypothetical protein